MKRGWAAALVVAAAFVMGAGCKTSVEVGSGCPAAMPASGAACDAAGESCDYTDGQCTTTFQCAEGTWETGAQDCLSPPVDCWSASEGDFCAVPGDSCGEGAGWCAGGFENTCGDDHRWHTGYYEGANCCPEWAQCPATEPYEGEACDPCYDATDCSYEGFCGGSYASCGQDGVWHVAVSDCPPPPIDPCAELGTQADCEATGCRWLIPGCGEPALPNAGCFAPTDCTPGDCYSPYSSCQEVVIDPCWDKACAACGMTVSLCLP